MKAFLLLCIAVSSLLPCQAQKEADGHDLPIFGGVGVQVGYTYLNTNLDLDIQPKTSLGVTYSLEFKGVKRMWMFSDVILMHNRFGAITSDKESVNLRFLGTTLRYGLSFGFGPGKRIKIGPMIQLGAKINLNPLKDYTICSSDGTCIKSKDIYGGFGEVNPGIRFGYMQGRILYAFVGSVSVFGKADIFGNKYGNSYAHLAATYYWLGPNDGGKKSTKQHNW